MSTMVAGLVNPATPKAKAKAKAKGTAKAKAKSKPDKDGDKNDRKGEPAAGSGSKQATDEDGTGGNTKGAKRALDNKDATEKKPLKESALRNTWNEFRNEYIAKHKGYGKTVQQLFKEAAEASPS